MNIKQRLSFQSRPLGFVLLAITVFGIISSLASFFYLLSTQPTMTYIITHSINFVGDIVTLIGSLFLIIGKKVGKVITQVGSAIFGFAGITFLYDSVLGGTFTISLALIFFVLANNAKTKDITSL